MGVSENVVYPNQPNGFADHKIPMKNGYFIGNIPYFQTHPYLMHSDTQKPAVKLWSDLIVTSMRPQANGRSTPWNSWSRPTYQGAETYGLFTLFTPQFVGVWRVWVINGTGWFNAKIFQPFISVDPLIPEVWAIPAMFLIAWWWSPPSIERYICIFPSILKLSASSEVPILAVIESYIVCYPQTLKTVNF